MWDPYAEFQHKKIANGPDIYACHWPNRSREKVHIIVHAGSLQDKKGREGTAHLLEHLLCYGGKIGGDVESDIFFKDQGGRINYNTSTFATQCHFYGPARRDFLAPALAMVGKNIYNFSANEDLLAKERKIVTGEFRSYYPLQFTLEIEMRERRTLFSETPLERLIVPIGGSLESIEQISNSDLLAFYRQYYIPANISIVAVGGMPVEEVFRLVEDGPFSAGGGSRVELPKAMSDLPALAENNYDFSASCYLKNSASFNCSRLKISVVLPGTIARAPVSIFSDLVKEAVNNEIREKRRWSYGLKSECIDYKALHAMVLQFHDLPPNKLAETEVAIKSAVNSLWWDEKLLEIIRRRRVNRLDIGGYPFHLTHSPRSN